MPDVSSPLSTRSPAGRRFRFSIQAMTATVAVVAVECLVLIKTDDGGVLIAGAILTAGFVCSWLSNGGSRRFRFGFEVAGLAAVMACVAIIQIDARRVDPHPGRLTLIDRDAG